MKAKAAAEGSPRRVGWTHACLPCDATWSGTAADHACRWVAQWRRNLWIQRFRWAMPNAKLAELAAMVDQPIERAKLVEILGPQWAEGRDAR